MKKIENGTIEVILFEEFDLDRYVEEGNFVEKVTEGTVNKTHGIFLGCDDGFVVGFEAFVSTYYQFAIETGEFVMVGEVEVRHRGVAFEVSLQRGRVGDARDEQQLGVESRESIIVRIERDGVGVVDIGEEEFLIARVAEREMVAYLLTFLR